MKINLEIPDDIVEDFKDRNLRIFAGIELIAEKNRGDKWQIKISGCSMCGECCKQLPKNFIFPTINGQCIYLVNPEGYGDKWICGLKTNRPFGCAVGNSTLKNCTVKYEYLKE